MREITKADMDKPIEPKMARDAVTAVRDICPSTFGAMRIKRSIKLITACATRIATRCTA